MKIPWLVRLVFDPPDALDLRDDQGAIDHGKVMGFIIFTSFVVMALLDKLPSVGHTVVIGCLGFGLVGLRSLKAIMVSKALVASEAVAETKTVIDQTIKTIIERRDADHGIEPTP